MAKNILKKSLALGVLMTFLITGSVWAAEENNTNNLITDDDANIFVGNSSKPPSSDSITVTNVVAMGKNITYSNGSENLVLLGKDVDANGNRLVYIGSNINKHPSSDDIKEAITNYLANLDSSSPSNDSNNVAIGSIINITGKNSVAIGMGVNVEANNAIAIGSGSAVAVGENGTVSFGRYLENGQEIKRKLTHVAEGTISKNSTDAVNAGQLYKEQEERKYSDLVLSNTINKEIEDRKYADTVLNNALIKETEERKYSDLVLSNTINKEIEDRKYADTVLNNALIKETEERKYSDLVLSNTINKEIEDRKYADTVLNNALIKETEERKYSDLVLSNTINKEIEDRKYADTVLNNKLDAEIDRSLSKDVEHDTKLQHITADADGTYIKGTTYFNKYTDNQVIINENGIKVGVASSVIDTNGVYTGGDTFEQSKAAINGTGEIKGANGNFTVASTGDTAIAGKLDVTSSNGRFAVEDTYIATSVETTNTKAGSINIGSFLGDRVTDTANKKWSLTGKTEDGILNRVVQSGSYTDVIQTIEGIHVTTMALDDSLTSKTTTGTQISGTDISIEDPKDYHNRIALSDVGQVDNIDSELKANASFDQTIVGAINAEANLRRVEINRLGSRVDKVGAGAAALAALHPLDFDPDDKLQFSAGVGNYAGETATALGAFYRPTEKVMFNVSGTMGTGEDMVNAGITFALDGRNNVSNSRVAMAHEIQDLRAQVAQLTSNQAQMMALLNKVLDGQADELLANVMFPDVPENHWAYEYLNSLQKRGILKGYPDGTFGGDRSLTRYEYAAMLYRVLEQGISVDTRLLNEFEAELGRIRIDRIKGKDDSYAKIERIRVVNNADRDDYGNKIITVSSNTAQ